MTNGKCPARADELEERLIDFAVRIIRLSLSLPKTPAGKHIAGQILRSGTSPAPNYGEARGAKSHADFVHKLRVVLKELNETSIWLRVIERGRLMKEELLKEICERAGNYAVSLRYQSKRREPDAEISSIFHFSFVICHLPLFGNDKCQYLLREMTYET